MFAAVTSPFVRIAVDPGRRALYPPRAMSETKETVEMEPDNRLDPVIEGLRATYRRRLWVVIYAAPALAVASWLVTYSLAVAGVSFGLTMGGAMLVANRMSKSKDSTLIEILKEEPALVERLSLEARPGGSGGIYTMHVTVEGKGRYMLYLPSRAKMEAALRVFHGRCPGAELEVDGVVGGQAAGDQATTGDEGSASPARDESGRAEISGSET